MNLLKSSPLLFLLVLPIGAQNIKPCDASVRFVDKNMIDNTIKVKALRGSIIDSTGAPIYEGYIAVFANDRSKLLRTVEADSNGNFEIKHVKSGDYWLVIPRRPTGILPSCDACQIEVVRAKGKDRCPYGARSH